MYVNLEAEKLLFEILKSITLCLNKNKQNLFSFIRERTKKATLKCYVDIHSSNWKLHLKYCQVVFLISYYS